MRWAFAARYHDDLYTSIVLPTIPMSEFRPMYSGGVVLGPPISRLVKDAELAKGSRDFHSR
jgi:hypothetical protein